MRKLTMSIALLALSGLGQGVLAADDKVTICHKSSKTAAVPGPAVPGHLQHGDTLGVCNAPPPSTMAAVVMVRCEPQEGTVKVVAASSSSSPAIAGGIAPGDNCAVILAELIDAHYGLRSVTTGSAGDSRLQLYTDYLLLGKVPVSP